MTSFTLAVLANALIILMLLELGRQSPRLREPERQPVTFSLQPAPREAAAHARAVVKPKRASKSAAAASHAARSVEPPHERPPTPPKLIIMNHAEFAASDISSLPSHHDGEEETADNAGSGKDSGSVYGPGEGPGGARLYNAEWYVEPSHTALATYMPQGGAPPGGWAMVACKTLPKYHVDDCRELGESPAGSGLSRALRQAAWQFLVRPPRIDGKPLIGVWVRIRFDFTEKAGKAE